METSGWFTCSGCGIFKPGYELVPCERHVDGYLVREEEFKTCEEAKAYAIERWTKDIEQYLVEIK